MWGALAVVGRIFCYRLITVDSRVLVSILLAVLYCLRSTFLSRAFAQLSFCRPACLSLGDSTWLRGQELRRAALGTE